MPQPNPGNVAGAMSQVRNALRMLEQALPMIPMGSPLHNDVLGTLSKLGKHIGGPGEGGQGMDMQSLLQHVKSQSQQAPMAALQRLFPQQPNQPPAMPGAPGGGGPGGPGGPPIMPTGNGPPGGG